LRQNLSLLQIILKVIDNHSQHRYSQFMIYCVCNQINTKKVDEAVCCGARTAKCVLAHHGKKFNCGACADSIKDRMAELHDATMMEPAE